MVYTPSKHPNLVNDVVAALIPKVGLAEYKPLIEGIRQKLRSATTTDHQFASQLQRSTPRYLRIIATRDTKRAESFKADSKGDGSGLISFSKMLCGIQHHVYIKVN